MNNQNNKMQLDLGFAVLSVEIDTLADYPAAYIGLSDKNGSWIQDIVCVRSKMDKCSEEPLPILEALVYGDKDIDDCTHRIECEVHRDYYHLYNEDHSCNLLVLATSDQQAITLADQYAQKYTVYSSDKWTAVYLTDEEFNNGKFDANIQEYDSWDCDYVLQDNAFEKLKGVHFLDELGLLKNKPNTL